MAIVTTAFCTTAKQELASGAHSFLASNAQLGNGVGTGNTWIYGLTNTAAIGVGMSVAVSNVTQNSNSAWFVASVVNSTAVTTSKVAAATGNCGTVTFAGDQFYFGLINATPQFAWGASANSYGYGAGVGTPAANLVGSDELTSGNVGYSVGGFALTNISPAISGTVAFWSFSANPSWTGATFSTSGGFIYNSEAKIGCAGGVNAGNGRMISIHSFGGVQSVSAGTFTVVLPTNGSGTSILQIS
jgi:hypothetical protein